MAVYQIDTRPGKTKLGHNLETREIVSDLTKKFFKANKTEKEIFEILKADKEISIKEIDTTKPETLTPTPQENKTEEKKPRTPRGN